jgi:hypothetical protein
MLCQASAPDSREHQSICQVSSQHVFTALSFTELTFWHSKVMITSSPSRYEVPSIHRHYCNYCKSCECETGDCPECQACEESDYGVRLPTQLCDAIALFPNAVDLSLDWEVSDTGIYDLAPNSCSGDQLRHLKRIDIVLRCYGSVPMYASKQAAEARMILAHLHMPILETVGIDFHVSGDGLGYQDEFGAIRQALCEIKSPNLKCVSVNGSMPLWGEPFPLAWVSPMFLF